MTMDKSAQQVSSTEFIKRNPIISHSELMKFFGLRYKSQLTARIKKMKLRGFFLCREVNGKTVKEKYYSLKKFEEFINK
jgi:hypothetical protein